MYHRAYRLCSPNPLAKPAPPLDAQALDSIGQQQFLFTRKADQASQHMQAGWIFLSAKDAFLTRHYISPFHWFSSSSLTGLLEKYTVCPFFFHFYAGGGKGCKGKLPMGQGCVDKGLSQSGAGSCIF